MDSRQQGLSDRKNRPDDASDEGKVAVEPSEALDAVHSLMHRFAPENHDFRQGYITGNEPTDGLWFYHPIDVAVGGPSPVCHGFGFLGFGEQFAELWVIVDEDAREEERPSFIGRFLYTDPNLMQHIVETLPAVGVIVPSHLTSEVERLQAALRDKAQERAQSRKD